MGMSNVGECTMRVAPLHSFQTLEGSTTMGETNDKIRIHAMKVEIIEMFNTPPEIIFGVLTDIPHHVDWMVEPLELVSLVGGPAKFGTQWEQNAERLGRKLVTLNVCNIYIKNWVFGWKSEKPFPAQVMLILEPFGEITKLTWTVESEEGGTVQLVEPLLVRQTDEMIKKSLACLKEYLQEK
jgi:hypothetical protein